MKQNGADYTVGGDGVMQYYDNVVKTMGATKVNAFIRYYVNPGVNHGGSGIQADGSEVPDRVDLIGALDKWVETNQAPGTLTVASYAKGDATTPLAVRPLCTYPNYPQYVSGDPKAASSFTCKSLH
jgi:feruloyl esterase